jgi:type II secretory pathway component PulJ
MNSPFAHLNTAAIRAERRSNLRRTVTDAATLLAVIVAAVVLASAALNTARVLPDIIAESATRAAW